MSTTKDLTKEAPRGPREKVGQYILLGRAIDKGRAALAGKVGEYHFDCPLDNMLFGFKEVKGEEVKKLLASGASDQEVASWIDSHGAKKTSAEIKTWADEVAGYKPYENPEKKDWFVGECSKLGIDPAKSTLFDMLEADDRISFAK
jgi:Domain of unknown function (DUF5069)